MFSFQVSLDPSKPNEKRYIDIIKGLIDKENYKKKQILFESLDAFIKKDHVLLSEMESILDNNNEQLIENNNNIIEEIRDLKLMIKGISTGGYVPVKEDKIEDDEEEVLGVDTSSKTRIVI